MSACPTFLQMTERDQEDMYAADDLGKRIVGRLPDDMTREWFTLSSDELKPEQIEATMDLLDSMGARYKFREALEYARLYGGSGIIAGTRGFDNKAEDPIDLNNIQSVEFLTVLHRWELNPEVPINGDVMSMNFGRPDHYRLNLRTGSEADAARAQQLVHWTRLMRFDGDPLPRQIFRENNYWSASVFNRLQNALRNYQTSHDGVACIMQDFAQAVYKIKDLADIVSSKDGAELLNNRLEAVDLCRSVLNAVLIGEDEEFERKTTTLTGIKEVMEIINNRLVAATDMPHTILLGEGTKAGLGDKGESEKRDWYDFVHAKQNEMLRWNLEYIIRLIFLSKQGPTGGVEPANWELTFNNLWKPTLKEEKETQKIQSEIDEKYANLGVLGPDEIRESRYGQEKFSYETKIDDSGVPQDERLPPIDEPEEDNQGDEA